MSKINKRYDRRTAVSVVIANMIGTGVFTSLGFQLLDIHSAPVILLLWFVGGVSGLVARWGDMWKIICFVSFLVARRVGLSKKHLFLSLIHI